MPAGKETSTKKKTLRACDKCRKRKHRCDGPSKPDHICSNCLMNSLDCTYDQAAPRRGPSKSYVKCLEKRVEQVEILLRRLRPDVDLSQDLDEDSDSEDAHFDDKSSSLSAQAPLSMHANSAGGELGSDAEDTVELLERLKLSNQPKNPRIGLISHRFFGQSSNPYMVKLALEIKNQMYGMPNQPVASVLKVMAGRRPQYWNYPSWEDAIYHSDSNRSRVITYDFPDPDLIPILVDSFFTNLNSLFSLLHRPTFERSCASKLYNHDADFARVLLAVCAIGSRHVDDPRVLWDGSTFYSAGWKWFNQIWCDQKSLLAPPSLEDMQVYCLTAMFLSGSSTPQSCWAVVAEGIRFAQDVGAHRRKAYNDKPSVVDELWKRAFWLLVIYDRSLSATVGRSCAIQDEDFDLDLPIECDDEYWEHRNPDLAFKQPPGMPPSTSFLTHLIKLQEILSFALRTIFSINKSKAKLGFVGPDWERKVVAQIDSAMDKWLESLPAHLRWDPTRRHATFFHQSAILHQFFHGTRITIHRRFVVNRNKSPELAAASLVISTDAARAGIRILDVHYRRHRIVSPGQLMTAYMAGVILLLRIWTAKQAESAVDEKDLEDVYRCMDIIKDSHPRWFVADKLWSDMRHLASVNGLPLPASFTFTPLEHDVREVNVHQFGVFSPTRFTAPTAQPGPAQPLGPVGGYAPNSFCPEGQEENYCMPGIGQGPPNNPELFNWGKDLSVWSWDMGSSGASMTDAFHDPVQVSGPPTQAPAGDFLMDNTWSGFQLNDDAMSLWLRAPPSSWPDEWGPTPLTGGSTQQS